jgi:hypothetical protein
MSKINCNPVYPPLFPISPAENACPFKTIALDFIMKLPPSGGHCKVGEHAGLGTTHFWTTWCIYALPNLHINLARVFISCVLHHLRLCHFPFTFSLQDHWLSSI